MIFASKAYSFRVKAKLFNSVVTPAVLYSCASWTLTQSMEQDLITARRKMLRTMLCAHRCSDEEWVAFIQCTTVIAEDHMRALGYETWVHSYKRHKWHFTRKVLQTNENKWSKRILQWIPFFRCLPVRRAGHPHARSEDCINNLIGENWKAIAADYALWRLLEERFVSL